MTAILDNSFPERRRSANPVIPVIAARRAYSTPLQAVRRRQQALDQLAARGAFPRPAQPAMHDQSGSAAHPQRPVRRPGLPTTPAPGRTPVTGSQPPYTSNPPARGPLAPVQLAPLGSALSPVPLSPTPGPSVQLTAREVEVLRTWLLVDSKSEAAAALTISVGTVNTHLARIRAKYAEAGRPARTKASLVARAIQDGLVVLDEL